MKEENLELFKLVTGEVLIGEVLPDEFPSLQGTPSQLSDPIRYDICYPCVFHMVPTNQQGRMQILFMPYFIQAKDEEELMELFVLDNKFVICHYKPSTQVKNAFINFAMEVKASYSNILLSKGTLQ
jgi:hypothetical protein